MVNLNQEVTQKIFKPALPKRVKLVLMALVLSAIIFPAVNLFIHVKSASNHSKLLLASLRQNNLDQASLETKELIKDLSSIDASLNWYIILKLVPGINGYVNDATKLTKAANYELQALDISLSLLAPYKTELGLNGQQIPGQDKIAQISKILDKLLPNLGQIEPLFDKAKIEVSDIDTEKYPDKIGKYPVKVSVSLAKTFIQGIGQAISDDQPLIQKLPDVLGVNLPKTYLVLFQNDKELRSTGGFITAYAFLKLDKGHLSTTASDDIYRLDEQLLKACLTKICPLKPPAPIVKYLPEFSGKPRTAWSMRDSNISPDFSISAKQFESMYNLLPGKTQFDGIVAIDTHVVESLVNIIGPVDIFGAKYSSEIDARCSCPNVIFELENYAQITSRGDEDRKAILGNLMQQIMAKSLGSSPEKFPDLINTGINLASQKHILFFMHDADVQKGLSNLGWTGEIKNGPGDYLLINDSNFAGGKSNLYVDEVVTLDINTSGNIIKHKLNIDYKNPKPFNAWLNGILRDYLRIYLPKQAKLINSKGSEEVSISQIDEALDKTYLESFLQVRPTNSRNIWFEYELPKPQDGNNLKLLIQKQPGAKNHHYIIRLNSQTKAEFDLIADTEINLDL